MVDIRGSGIGAVNKRLWQREAGIVEDSYVSVTVMKGGTADPKGSERGGMING